VSLVDAISVHAYAPQWELTGVFAPLALAAALILLAWRVHRVRALAGWGAFGCLLVSMLFAIVHGWGAEVRVLNILARLIVAVFVIVVAVRLARARMRLRRAIAQADKQTPATAHAPTKSALLADATPPTIIYPAKGKLAALTAVLLGFMVGFGALGIALVIPGNAQMAIAGVACLATVAFMALFLALMLLRPIARRPALTLTSLGLIDDVSSIAVGAGPVWWDEIAGMAIYSTPRRGCGKANHYLLFVPVDPHAIIHRQPLPTRMLLRLLSPIPSASTLMPVHIPEWLLPISLEELEAQIQRYVPMEPPPALDDIGDEAANRLSTRCSEVLERLPSDTMKALLVNALGPARHEPQDRRRRLASLAGVTSREAQRSRRKRPCDGGVTHGR
jgi:hypothetical protein